MRDRCEAHLNKLVRCVLPGASVSCEASKTCTGSLASVSRGLARPRGRRGGHTKTLLLAPIGLIRYAQLMDAEKPWLSPLQTRRRMAEVFSTWTL